MRHLFIALALSAASPAAAAEFTSEYSDLDLAGGCSTFALVEEGASIGQVCPGWGGYPVIVNGGDLRMSVFYGFPKAADDTTWESFVAFNSVGPKIEWRIEVDGEKKVPFATIHRWFVNDDPENPDAKTEVLVVEKVGRLGEGDGCAVGLVMASGNPQANDTARRIADEQAHGFVCGADERVIVGGDIAMPQFDRQE
jgi:hypothetical protein